MFHLRFIIALLLCCRLLPAQPLSMDDAVSIALANHPTSRNAALSEQKDMLLQRQSVALPPTRVTYLHSNAIAATDRLWSVMQDFGSIPEHFRRSSHHSAIASVRRAERSLSIDELAWQVKSAYFDVIYHQQRLQIMRSHENYFEALISTAEIYLDADSIAELTKVSAGTRYATYQSRMYIAEEELKRARARLCQLLYLPDDAIEISLTELELYQIHPEKDLNLRFDAVKHAALDDAQQKEATAAVLLERSKLYPSLHAGYLYGHVAGMGHFHGWMAGLSIPLWFQPQRARIRQTEIDADIRANEAAYRQFYYRQHVVTLQSLLNEYFVQVSFGKENLLVEAQLVLSRVEDDFAAGRITDYAEAFTKVNNAVSVKIKHLEYINLYNQTALELEYYTQ